MSKHEGSHRYASPSLELLLGESAGGTRGIQDYIHPDDLAQVTGVSAIIAMAQKLNMEVLAEGVETHQQVDFLRLNQCNILQG